ncbi:protein white-like [Ruditapes philippinarum]|uniref:protein white-like n=1 Tax=Ruditapes philippinarum TaxID=129788 RepID=UPI00295B6A2F|nr:protein white-like [Ruditapes philippinarum]
MAEGRVAFMGRAQDALAFFSSAGYPCPKTFNPADFYVLTLAVRPGKEDECKEKIENICDKFDSSTYSKTIKNISDATTVETDHLQIKDSILKEDRYVGIF